MGYIYLICDPANDAYKIGVTRDLSSNRLKKLLTGNTTLLHIVHIYKCEYPFRLEKMLHSHFKNDQALNEWFYLSNKDVYDFRNTCIEIDKRISSLICNPYFIKNIK